MLPLNFHCTHLVALDGPEHQHELVSNANGHDGHAVLLGQHGQEREQNAERQVYGGGGGGGRPPGVCPPGRWRRWHVSGSDVPAVAQERQHEEHAGQDVGAADYGGHGVSVHRVHGEQGRGQQCGPPARHRPGHVQHQARGQAVQRHVRRVVRRGS